MLKGYQGGSDGTGQARAADHGGHLPAGAGHGRGSSRRAGRHAKLLRGARHDALPRGQRAAPPRAGRGPVRLPADRGPFQGPQVRSGSPGPHLLRRLRARRGGGADRGCEAGEGRPRPPPGPDCTGAEGGPLMDSLIEVFGKASLILAAGAAGALLARKASAATRHLIWTASLVGALALPLAIAVLPRMAVVALPPRSEPEALRAPVASPRAAHSAATRTPERPAPVEQVLPDLASSAPELAKPLLASLDWGRAIRLLWASVALALLLRIAAGDLQLRGIARRAQRVVAREWLHLLRQCAASAGV